VAAAPTRAAEVAAWAAPRPGAAGAVLLAWPPAAGPAGEPAASSARALLTEAVRPVFPRQQAAGRPAHGLRTWHGRQARPRAGSARPGAWAVGRAQRPDLSWWAHRWSERRPLAHQDGAAALCRAQPWSAPPDASAGSCRVQLPSTARAFRPAESLLPLPAAPAAHHGSPEPAACWRQATWSAARRSVLYLGGHQVAHLVAHLARHWPASREVSRASPSAGPSRSAASAPCPAGSEPRAA
jgi:hypothetical protein